MEPICAGDAKDQGQEEQSEDRLEDDT